MGGINMDIRFSSLNELYERLGPALNSKVNELIRNKYNYIKKEDIWNYLKNSKWLHSSNLSLAEMVNDILNCSDYEIDKYVKDQLKNQNRTAYFNDLDNLL